MPPPKQKPIAPSGARDRRACAISVTAAFMSSSKRFGLVPEIADSAAIDLRLVRERRRAALLGEQVERERREPVGGEPPRDVRMWSVSPRFSWMTSTPPRGFAPAAPTPPCSGPRGPANVIGFVATGAQASPPSVAVPVAVPVAVAVVAAAAAARAASAASMPAAAVAPTPSSAEPPHRLPTRDDPVDVVLGDLFREVPLQLRHPTLPVER